MKRHDPEASRAPQSKAVGGTRHSGQGPAAAPGDRTDQAEARLGLTGEPDRGDVFPDREIALRAYGIWKAGGYRGGTDQEDWFEAERQLRMERGGRHATTPAEAGNRAREEDESHRAREAEASIRDRMVSIGRGNQQAGRQGS